MTCPNPPRRVDRGTSQRTPRDPAPRVVASHRRLASRALGVVVSTLGVSGSLPTVSADQMVVEGITYPNARILSLEEGRLRFRSAEGALHTTWLNDVELILVDRGGEFRDFNQAERFLADGQPRRAVVRYRRAQRLVETFWSELVTARMLTAYDAAAQVDKAVGEFVRVLRGHWTGPPAAARLIPKTFPDKRDSRVIRAIEQLDTALSGDLEPAQQALLTLTRYDLLRRYGGELASAAANDIIAVRLPEPVRSDAAYGIVREAFRSTLKNGTSVTWFDALDQAIRDCPRPVLPDFLLLKGQALLTTATSRDDLIRAAWSLLRVPIHFPNDPRAGRGLYHAALVMERLGRSDKAKELLEECRGSKVADKATKTQAVEALDRLARQSAVTGGG